MKKDLVSRRNFIKKCLNTAGTGTVLGLSYALIKKSIASEYIWQIDPYKCVQCGRCSTDCVLSQSAVKCVHSFDMCGYCKLCYGYFKPGFYEMETGAENQLCPTGAIKRKFIENPFYEYTIDYDLCIGCGKCVKACSMFGNRSLYLQVSHKYCLNCNECSIMKNCPSNAYKRIRSEKAFLLKVPL